MSEFGEFAVNFDRFAKAINNNAKEKGFYDDPPRVLERIALMHEELGEASSWYRRNNPLSDHIPEFSEMEEELADCVIRIMDFAAYQNLNVAEALLAKHEFNKSRPYKHGKIK